MRALVVAIRELRAVFDAPTGYVVLALFPALAAFFFFATGGFFDIGEASLRGFFGLMPWLLVLLAPAVTMRMWAEERRSGTEELLRSYPFRVSDLVLGKFLGALGVLAAALVLTLAVPLTVTGLGDLDWGPVLGGYLSTLLLGSASLAVGLFLSACTQNQIVAWMLAAVVLVGFNLIGAAATAEAMPPELGRLLLAADFGQRFHAITRGVVDLRDVLFYVGATTFFLAANGIALERRRWT